MNQAPDTDPLARIARISDGMRDLRARLSTLRAAWPTGQTFDGQDASGALRLQLSSDGTVSRVDLTADWLTRIDARSLARAVNEAIGAASARLGDAWVDEWDSPTAERTAPAPRLPLVTLDEYRRVFPPPATREQLRAKADQAAELREELGRRRPAPPAREEFRSPSGLFTVTRSRSQLTGLSADQNALATATPEAVGREIVAVCAQIEHRALGDTDNGPLTTRLEQLRALRAES